MREKYIEERHPRWFTMDIERAWIDDANSSIGKTAGPSETAAICAEHNLLLDKFIHMAQAWSEQDSDAFKEYWYDT